MTKLLDSNKKIDNNIDFLIELLKINQTTNINFKPKYSETLPLFKKFFFKLPVILDTLI